MRAGGGPGEAQARPARNAALAGLFAALTAVGAQIQTPLPFSPVPIVLSNLLAILAGLVLGPRLGATSQAVYVLVGAAGVPVFAGLHGGAAVLVGPTGGYLVGFVLAAAVAGGLQGAPPQATWRVLWAAAAGAAAIYVPGLLWLAATTGMDARRTLLLGALPFLPGDLLKVIAAAVAAPALALAAGTRSAGRAQ